MGGRFERWWRITRRPTKNPAFLCKKNHRTLPQECFQTPEVQTLKSVDMTLDWDMSLLSHLIPVTLPFLQSRPATCQSPHALMRPCQVYRNANHIRVCRVFLSNADAFMV